LLPAACRFTPSFSIRKDRSMKPLLVVLALGVAGCSPTAITTALDTPTGQLFCAVQTGGGGAVVVALIDAAATAAAPAAAPVAVIATGAGQAVVNADCALAKGIPVSPPPLPATAPQVAIVVAPPAA
jgi:hypothetical protein